MKKFLLMLFSLFVLILTGCMNSEGQDAIDQETDENESVEQDTSDADGTVENAEGVQGTTENNNAEDETGENDELTLQLTKTDEESGTTLESDIYTEISQLMEEHPDMGTENDFSVFTVDIYNSEAGRSLVLLGINRTPIELTNISFDLNLGSIEALVLKDQPVHLSEEDMGIFPVDGVMPFIIDISDEQADALLNIDPAEIHLALDNFEYEEAE